MNLLPVIRDRLDRSARWLGANRRSLLATGAFASMSWGFHMAWEPLGFLVPGIIIFAALSWSHLTERPSRPEPEPKENQDA